MPNRPVPANGKAMPAAPITRTAINDALDEIVRAEALVDILSMAADSCVLAERRYSNAIGVTCMEITKYLDSAKALLGLNDHQPEGEE